MQRTEQREDKGKGKKKGGRDETKKPQKGRKGKGGETIDSNWCLEIKTVTGISSVILNIHTLTLMNILLEQHTTNSIFIMS